MKNILKALKTRKTISKSELILSKDDVVAAQYLEQKDLLETRTKIILVVFLVLSLLLAYILYRNEFLSKDGFSTIVAAVIGGFVGSAVNHLVSSK